MRTVQIILHAPLKLPRLTPDHVGRAYHQGIIVALLRFVNETATHEVQHERTRQRNLDKSSQLQGNIAEAKTRRDNLTWQMS